MKVEDIKNILIIGSGTMGQQIGCCLPPTDMMWCCMIFQMIF